MCFDPISKFGKLYFSIWRHKLTFIFKTKKLWLLVDGIEIKPIAPTITQITIGIPLLVTWIGRKYYREDENALALTIINNSIDNNIIQSFALAWAKLVGLFKSIYSIYSMTKMHIKDKLHTLKIKRIDNATQHIHIVWARMEQFLATNAIVSYDEIIFVLMNNMQVPRDINLKHLIKFSTMYKSFSRETNWS